MENFGIVKLFFNHVVSVKQYRNKKSSCLDAMFLNKLILNTNTIKDRIDFLFERNLFSMH